MPIILEYFIPIKRYIATIESIELEVLCPCCGRRTRKHGKYKRTVHFKTKSHEIPIMRRRCPDCKKTFSLIPCFIVPWGRFSNHIIEFLLRWVFFGIPLTLLPERLSTDEVSVISKKTVYRWKAKFFSRFLNWWKAERKRIAEHYQDGDGLLALYREGIGSADEFLLLVSFYFGEDPSIPKPGNLFSAIHFRQTLNSV